MDVELHNFDNLGDNNNRIKGFAAKLITIHIYFSIQIYKEKLRSFKTKNVTIFLHELT